MGTTFNDIAKENYKENLLKERSELKERLKNIHISNIKNEADRRTSSDIICRQSVTEQSRDLMVEQEEAMTRYLHVLEVRMVIAGIYFTD